MKTTVYLTVTKTGVLSATKGKPTLHSGQVAIKINLEVSDLFFDRFVPEVTISIPDHNVITPDIDVEVPDRTMEKLLGEEDKK